MLEKIGAEAQVPRKRPYLKKEWCIRVLEKPLRYEPQEGNRYRFWAEIEEPEGRISRVITLQDKEAAPGTPLGTSSAEDHEGAFPIPRCVV